MMFCTVPCSWCSVLFYVHGVLYCSMFLAFYVVLCSSCSMLFYVHGVLCCFMFMVFNVDVYISFLHVQPEQVSFFFPKEKKDDILSLAS